MNDKDVISVWAKKILAKCDQINDKEKAIEFAKRYGFLRGSIEFLVEHPEDMEFVGRYDGRIDGNEKENKERMDK